MVEPERIDLPAFLFFAGVGLASQAELSAAPWSRSRHWPGGSRQGE
jgi:hypothetical protein